MSKKIKLGDYNRLRIVKKVDFGLYLDGGDEERSSFHPATYLKTQASATSWMSSSISTRKSAS